METNEQKFTAREWLEMTLPQYGVWREDTKHTDLYHHWSPDQYGSRYQRSGRMSQDCCQIDGHKKTWQGTIIIPRATAIDLMVKAIEGQAVAQSATTAVDDTE